MTEAKRQREYEPHIWGICACGKRGYPTRRAARIAARQLGAASPGVAHRRSRAYQCDEEPYWWHLTTWGAAKTERFKDSR